MSEAHRKKKQPEQVRCSVLECTTKIAAEVGMARVTIEAVAKAAGITKGGLLHHFPSKQALIDAVVADMFDQIDQQLDDCMAKDAIAKGRFTRAYVEVTLDDSNFDPLDPWHSISLSMLTEPSCVDQFLTWFSQRLELHQATDDDPLLETIRFAADGAWLHLVAKKSADAIEQATAIRQRLIAMTLSIS